MPRAFTEENLSNDGLYYRIVCDKQDLIDSPLEWQRIGLQQTASGYGRKLTTRYKIRYNGKDYRIYATCYSNVASCWFVANGRKIYVD